MSHINTHCMFFVSLSSKITGLELKLNQNCIFIYPFNFNTHE